MCDRPPRPLADGEVIDLGGKRVRQIATPHVPHGWEAQVLFEETTGTLLCGDLFSHVGGGPAADHRRRHRAGHGRRGHVPRSRRWHPHTGATCAASATWPRRRWPSCTAASSRATAARRCYDLADAYEQQFLRRRRLTPPAI